MSPSDSGSFLREIDLNPAPEDFARIRKVRLILIWVMVGNLLVAFAKIIYGWISGSVSIKADGIHSLADSTSNIIGLLALSKAASQSDEEHPYGHRKLEVAGTFGIGLLILMGLLAIAHSLINANWSDYSLLIGKGGFMVVGFTLITNVLITWQEGAWGKKLNSPILMADAQHTLSDTYATLGVLLSFILSRFGIQKADLVIAALIMILIAKVCYKIFKQGIEILLDHSQIDAKEVERIVKKVPGVIDCHRVRSRGMEGAVYLDFHILVNSSLSVQESHEITHQSELAIKKNFPDVIDIVIHTEPASDGREPDPWEKPASEEK